MKTPHVVTSRKRMLITYAEHWHTSRIFLQLGIENPKGSYHQFLGSIVFTAFALEAFLNHVGESLFVSWPDLEKLTPKGKINVITEKLQIDVNYGEVPWQVVPEIFGVRNKVGHGKTELLQDEQMLSVDSYDELMGEILRAPWQQSATRENAEKARERVEQLCKTIWRRTNFDEHELFTSGMQSGSAQYVPGQDP